MTLSDGKRKVYMLMDEYSSGGVVTPDADIENKMADFFDTAQKQVAAIKPIRRVFTVERVSGQTDYAMPADYRKLICIRRDGKKTRRYDWRAGALVIPKGDTAEVEVEYCAWPATITPETPDTYEFEVAEDAQQAMPFYVASQQLISDLVLDYSALRGEYNAALAAITQDDTGAGMMRQVLYGTGRA